MNANEQLSQIHAQCEVWDAELSEQVARLTARLDGIRANNPVVYEKLGAETERELARVENDLIDLRTFAETLPQVKTDETDSWGSYILRLNEDAEFRAAESYRAELWALAHAKEVEKLSQWHEFMGGEVDLPILNGSTYEAAMERQRQNEDD